MTRGETKNILVPSVANKDIDQIENYIATAIDLRNVRLTDAGHWNKRSGYTQEWDLSTDKDIPLLIPEHSGYAISMHQVYKLGPSLAQLPGTIKLTGTYRPQWLRNKADIVIVDGGTPIEITPTGLVELPDNGGGTVSNFRYITAVGEYTIGAGHNDRTDAEYEFMWSAAGDYENWSTLDSGNVRIKKTGFIMNIAENAGKLYVFKDNEVEIWYNRGGDIPFARVPARIKKGLGASYAIIDNGETLHWLGDDWRIYRLNQDREELVSHPFEDYIQKLNGKESVYGFHNEKEHLNYWVYPIAGVTLIQDYRNNMWSEDNIWEHGQFERIPIASYMELNGNQYFGSYNMDGLIYKILDTTRDDDGTDMRVFKHFSVKPSPKGNRVKFNKVGFHFKRGVATSGVTAPVFSWRQRIDKGDWGDWDEIDLGAEGIHNPYIERTADYLGEGREIDFQIAETDAVEFIQTHMDLTIRELGS